MILDCIDIIVGFSSDLFDAIWRFKHLFVAEPRIHLIRNPCTPNVLEMRKGGYTANDLLTVMGCIRELPIRREAAQKNLQCCILSSLFMMTTYVGKARLNVTARG